MPLKEHLACDTLPATMNFTVNGSPVPDFTVLDVGSHQVEEGLERRKATTTSNHSTVAYLTFFFYYILFISEQNQNIFRYLSCSGPATTERESRSIRATRFLSKNTTPTRTKKTRFKSPANSFQFSKKNNNHNFVQYLLESDITYFKIFTSTTEVTNDAGIY